jgi:outer membrane protease
MDKQEWTIKKGQSRMDNQEWTIKNGQSRMDNQEWTIHRNRQHWAHKKQYEDEQNTTNTTQKAKKMSNMFPNKTSL